MFQTAVKRYWMIVVIYFSFYRYSAVIDFVPDECNVTLLKTDSEMGNSPLKTPNKVLETPKYSSPIGHKEQWPDAAKLEYKLLVIAGPKKGSFITSRGNQIRFACLYKLTFGT